MSSQGHKTEQPKRNSLNKDEEKDRKLIDQSKNLCLWAENTISNLKNRRQILENFKETVIDAGTKRKLFDAKDVEIIQQELNKNQDWSNSLEAALENVKTLRENLGGSAEVIERSRLEFLDKIDSETKVLSLHPNLFNKFVSKQNVMQKQIQGAHARIIENLGKVVDTVSKEMVIQGIAAVSSHPQ